MDVKRILCWFSCGIPSTVAAKVEIEENARRENPIPLEVCLKDEQRAIALCFMAAMVEAGDA